MKRFLPILLFALPLCATAQERHIDITGDRTVIYPQRMALTGDETLYDVLLLYPEMLMSGFADLLTSVVPETGEGALTTYQVRMDNVGITGNVRTILTSIKARDVERVQVCDNAVVAKGTGGLQGVIDVNLRHREPGTQGMIEVQGGTDGMATPMLNVMHTEEHRDLYILASYDRTQMEETTNDNTYLHALLSSRYSDRDLVYYYFTMQQSDGVNDRQRDMLIRHEGYQSLQGRLRWMHAFNDRGTELLSLVSYDHQVAPTTLMDGRSTEHSQSGRRTDMGMTLFELNTPLFTPDLGLMVGWEGSFARHRHTLDLTYLREAAGLDDDDPDAGIGALAQRRASRNTTATAGSDDPDAGIAAGYLDGGLDDSFGGYDDFDHDFLVPSEMNYRSDYRVFDNEVYALLDYRLGPVRLVAGDRLKLMHYGLRTADGEAMWRRNVPTNLWQATLTYTPHPHHQMQLAYHRRYIHPSYTAMMPEWLPSTDGWEWHRGNTALRAAPADVAKLAYGYTTRAFSAKAGATYIRTRDFVETENISPDRYTWVNRGRSQTWKLEAAASLVHGPLRLTLGANLYTTDHNPGAPATTMTEAHTAAPAHHRTTYITGRINAAVRLPYGMTADAALYAFSHDAPIRSLHNDCPLYAHLRLAKQLGRHIRLSLQWHDIFESERSAALATATYSF